jgi:hypothetical protein
LVDHAATTVTLSVTKVGDVAISERLVNKAGQADQEPATVSINGHLLGI